MAESINRTVSIGAEDAGFEDVIQKLRKSGEDMYDAIIKKAEIHSSKLNEQAIRVQNLIEKEKEAKAFIIEERKAILETERDTKISQLDPKTDRFSAEKKKLVDEYRESIKNLNKEMRDHNVTLNEATRRTREHFTTQERGQRGGGFMRGVGGGAMMGAVGGFMAGGGLGTMVGGLVGGIGGGIASSILPGTSAIGGALMAGAPILGASMNQGAVLASARARRDAMMTGLGGIPDLSNLGIDVAQTAQRQRQMGRLGGRGMAREVGRFAQLERGIGMESGELNQFAGLAQMGFGAEIPDLLGKFLNTAIDSDLWNVKSGDLSQIPRVLAELSTMMQMEAMVVARPTGMAGGFRTAFGGIGEEGGLFQGSRFPMMFQGFQQAMTQPANEFQRARMFEDVMRADPDLGMSPTALTTIQSRIAQGMFAKGAFGTTLERIREESGGDDAMFRERLVKRFKFLLPHFESEELSSLGTTDFIKKMKGLTGEKDIMSELNKALKTDLLAPGVSKTEQLQTQIRDSLMKTGEVITEKVAENLILLVEHAKTLPDDLAQALVDMGIAPKRDATTLANIAKTKRELDPTGAKFKTEPIQ